MDAGVGSSGGGKANRYSDHGLQGRLDFALDGPPARLVLPAGETAAVVFNGHSEILHLTPHGNSSTMDRDMNDRTVDIAMVADARSVLLLSCEDNT